MMSSKTPDFLISAQKEPAKHGSRMFPVAHYDAILSEDFPLIPLHWHEEAELTLIRSGSCMYHINLNDFLVKEGDIVFLPPMLLHSAGAFPKYRMQSETFVFHLNFLGAQAADICSLQYLRPFSSQELRLPYVIPASHPKNPVIREIMEKLSRIYRMCPDGYELFIKSLLLEVFFHLLPYKLPASSETSRPLARNQADKLKAVLDYIDANFVSPLTIQELARICCFSESHFMRFFKTHVGMTCTEYINTLRLEKAWQMLKSGNSSVLDTAFSCGFHNLSYFYRLFRQKYHRTPKDVLLS